MTIIALIAACVFGLAVFLLVAICMVGARADRLSERIRDNMTVKDVEIDEDSL
jgi:hypothetical protein